MTNVPAEQKTPRVIWQLGGGPTARSYADDLLKSGVALIGPGDAGQWTAEIVGEVRDLWPLFWNRDGFGDHPTEDELVAHLVVPFLRRLGWQPEQIAVKWHHIDVAVFKALPRTPENCHLVIEAKRLGAGVEGALGQAIGYVKALGVDRDVVVTDGVRYRMYAAGAAFAPVAYANLIRLKESAPALFARLRRP